MYHACMQKVDTSAVTELRAFGYRATKPRVRLLSYLHTQGQPVGVVQIAKALRGAMDTVTIYRTLAAFQKSGLVREIYLGKGAPMYELADTHDHHHVVCTSCGKIEDVELEHADLERRALKQTASFSNISAHSLEFFGECKKCSI